MRGIRGWFVTLSTLAIAGAVALACISPVENPAGSTVPGRCSHGAPLLTAQKTDILFVVDNSGSMAQEQDGIATELPAFIEELRRGAGTAHDFQVGVITTSVYLNPDPQTVTGVTYTEYPTQSGKLQAVPVLLSDGSTAPGTERLITSSDPDLVEKFRRLVRQGIQGSGQETPFEAVRLAVSPPLSTTPLAEGGNKEFFRDGARLLVVVVTDEDDCSENRRLPMVVVGNDTTRDYCTEQSNNLTPVAEYESVFRGLLDSTRAPRQVIWAAIAPVATTDKRAESFLDNGVIRNADCPTSFQPGFRHYAMAQRFDPTLANLDSICISSYRDSLLRIAQIANSAQVLDVENVPDPRLLKVEITRANGAVEPCTVANGGIEYLSATQQVRFTDSCSRLADDTSVAVQMICAG
jgi:hypothetical protein